MRNALAWTARTTTDRSSRATRGISGSSGNSCTSQPEICSGDHRNSSFASTTARNRGHTTNFDARGRHARRNAARSARHARYARRPPFLATSRDTVDGDRPNPHRDLAQRPARHQATRDLLTLRRRQPQRRPLPLTAGQVETTPTPPDGSRAEIGAPPHTYARTAHPPPTTQRSVPAPSPSGVLTRTPNGDQLDGRPAPFSACSSEPGRPLRREAADRRPLPRLSAATCPTRPCPCRGRHSRCRLRWRLPRAPVLRPSSRCRH